MIRAYALWLSTAAMLFMALGCLERPVGEVSPNTTNILVDRLIRSGVKKIDMLFVVDNSVSMGDKQALLAKALPDLVTRLVSPVCLTQEGQVAARPQSAAESCPQGSGREFEPVEDIHIGVITSSLGGFGASETCAASELLYSDQNVDMGHLVPTLPRWNGAPLAGGFLTWGAGTDASQFIADFKRMVENAGEHGCGYEAPLEAWYRFLVDPAPYAELVRMPCSADSAEDNCVGPKRGADGAPLLDEAILAQRAAFLRPDSLVAVVMLSDENDCSFRASGQSWLLARTHDSENAPTYAPRATAACEVEPNSECCRPCSAAAIPEGCATSTDSAGAVVQAGCEEGSYYTSISPAAIPSDSPGDVSDHPNLRCFDQKRRFGIDALYPVERYVNALTSGTLCSARHDLAPSGCSEPMENPLLFPRDVAGAALPPRNPDLVYLAGIVGVPWQDIAQSSDPAEPLRYLPSTPTEVDGLVRGIDWSQLLGDGNGTPPGDPLMREQVLPRSGTTPSTGEALAAPDAPLMANSINGHDRLIPGDDLQHACIFPLESPVECPTQADVNTARDDGRPLPGCDCSGDDGATELNPLCQQEDGSYSRRQRFGKAYPGSRQLQVLQKVASNAVVASICPKQTSDTEARDFGYRPAVDTLIERLKRNLAGKCMPRPLAVDGDGIAACTVVEVQPAGAAPCETQAARFAVSVSIEQQLRARLTQWDTCPGGNCDATQLCGIRRLDETNPTEAQSCQEDSNANGDGWCYIDPDVGVGSPALVDGCPATERRKIRFVGDGNPQDDYPTVIACAGATYDRTLTSRPLAL